MASVAGKSVSLSRAPYSTYQQRRPTPQETSSMAQKKAAAEAAAAKAKSKMLVELHTKCLHYELCTKINEL